MTTHVFVGYDAREDEAARVCAASIRANAGGPVKVYKLEHRALRRAGAFDRPWRVDERGQFIDERDGRPFSTEFSHSRFLAPYLAWRAGIEETCVFLDCDFLIRGPIDALAREHEESARYLSCVKREANTVHVLKMDGMAQANYNRKLWSALFAFTPCDRLATHFQPDVVNYVPGRALHAFLNVADDVIGDIGARWHYVPSLDGEPAFTDALGVHYSEFSPWLNPAHDSSWSYAPWLAARASYDLRDPLLFDRIEGVD